MIDSKRILDAARDFKITSKILTSRFGGVVFPIRSTIVTTAFPIELYLKYLAAHEGVVARGHDLNALYMKLSKNLKDKIDSKFDGTRSVSNILQEYKNLFVDWRYIYEKQDGSFGVSDIQSLMALRDKLEVVASECT
jgi:hypothetical protein